MEYGKNHPGPHKLQPVGDCCLCSCCAWRANGRAHPPPPLTLSPQSSQSQSTCIHPLPTPRCHMTFSVSSIIHHLFVNHSKGYFPWFWTLRTQTGVPGRGHPLPAPLLLWDAPHIRFHAHCSQIGHPRPLSRTAAWWPRFAGPLEEGSVTVMRVPVNVLPAHHARWPPCQLALQLLLNVSKPFLALNCPGAPISSYLHTKEWFAQLKPGLQKLGCQ